LLGLLCVCLKCDFVALWEAGSVVVASEHEVDGVIGVWDDSVIRQMVV